MLNKLKRIALFAAIVFSVGYAEAMESEEKIIPFEPKESLFKQIKNNEFKENKLSLVCNPHYDDPYDLPFLPLNDQDIINLSEALKTNSHITNVSLIGNNITDVGAITLAQCPNIKILDLSLTNVTEKSCIELAKTKIEKLFLETTYIHYNNEPYFQEFMETLCHNRFIKELNLSDCYLNDGFIEKLIRKNKTIETLWVGNNLTDEAFKAIKENTTIKKLYIGENTLTDLGAEYISQNISLEKLHIGTSSITDNGLQNLLLPPTLKYLTLVNSDITRKGLECVYISQLKKFSFSNGLKKDILTQEEKLEFEKKFLDSKK